MKNLLAFLPAFLIASTVVAEPTAAQYLAPEVPFEGGYTKTLMLPDGTLEYVVAFTTVNDESNPYTWQVPANVSKIDYLVVAGGGGGGTGSNSSTGGGGGGGGGGGMLTGTLNSISADTDFSIRVGDGGAGGSGGNKVANNGENSFIKADGVIDDIVAIGGGAGGSAYSDAVSSGSYGGSGGGAAGTGGSSAYTATTGGTCAEGQGFVGGDRTSSTSQNRPGAGGGGAGEAGITITTASTGNRGHGGDGKYSYITGVQVWYAGGGGGGSYAYTKDNNGLGGAGGGGAGGNYNNEPRNSGASGTDSTGGGGGGARGYYSGGSGGSGIVVLRYALNNDNFQGIVVDTTTEKFGNPSPAYDIYKELPSNSAFTCPKYTVLSEGARATCIGWELYGRNEEGEEYLIRSDTFDTENPPYEETDLSKTITFTRNYSEKGVVLKWKFVKEYYVSTVASCERGSLVADKSGWYREGDTIQVAITSIDNFIGWGGWGNGTQRSVEPSKTIAVVAAPMTITAYFTAHDKDNLVLNGDFEMNKNPSPQDSIINSTDNLTAGNWERISSGYTSYNSGLVTTTAEKNSQVKSYSGLSAIICSSSASTATRKNGTIKCTVHVPCSGLYDLSFMNDTGYANSGMKGLKWNVDVDLITSNNAKTNELVNLQQKANMNWHQENFKVIIHRGGLYTLQFSVDRYSIMNDPEASASSGSNASSAFDNIELKLDKRFGFAIKVR